MDDTVQDIPAPFCPALYCIK